MNEPAAYGCYCDEELDHDGDPRVVMCGDHAAWIRTLRATRAYSYQMIGQAWYVRKLVPWVRGGAESFGRELVRAAADALVEDEESWDADTQRVLEEKEELGDSDVEA